MNILKSYFNMYNIRSERIIRLRRLRLWKRKRLGRKIWVSKPELKHTNNSIIINVYIYNRQYNWFLLKIKKIKLFWLKKTKIRGKILKKSFLNKSLKKLGEKFNKIILKAVLTKKRRDILSGILYETYNIMFNKYIKAIRWIFKTQILIFRYKQIMFLNKLKSKEKYLMPIKYLLQKIYNKKVYFNIVSLKNFNFNSSILAQILIYKINNRRNKPLRVIGYSIRKSKVFSLNKYLLTNNKPFTLNINNLFNKYSKINPINTLLHNEYSDFNKNLPIKHQISEKKQQDKFYWNTVLSSTKNKSMIGIKVKVSGRITRRLIAQRSLCKIRYKGSLKNMDSSYRGYSTPILKGYEKSNLQYTHLSYKRKIGAFGIKGWINSI